MNDDKLRIDIERMLGHPKYKHNKYTDMVRKINDSHFTFTKKQRAALVTHLTKFWNDIIK